FGGAITGTSTLNITGLTTLGNASTTQIGSTGSAYFATASGNVGIGTTVPGAKLHVSGGDLHLQAPSHLSGDFSEKRYVTWTQETDVPIAKIGAERQNWANGATDLTFSTYFNGMKEAMRITSGDASNSGNVGIGTTSPLAKLSVKGGGTTTGLAFQLTDSADSPKVTILDSGNVGIGTTGPGQLLQIGASPHGLGFDYNLGSWPSLAGIYTSTGGGSYPFDVYGNLLIKPRTGDYDIVFGTGNPTVANVVIQHGGNVGIGTTSPDTALAIYRPSGTSQLRIGANGAWNWDISRDNDSTGDLWFTNTANGVATNRMTIKATGNVGIGTTSPLYKLAIQNTADGNTLQIYDTDGNCLLNPETSALDTTCTSDMRLKTDIVNTGSVLSYLSNIPIRDYTVISSGDKRTGVIAQELLANYPELVSMGTDGYYGVKEINSWKLIKGIQELDTKIISLASTTISSLETVTATTTDQLSLAMNAIKTLEDQFNKLNTKFDLLASSTPPTPTIDLAEIASTTGETLSKSDSFIITILNAIIAKLSDFGVTISQAFTRINNLFVRDINIEGKLCVEDVCVDKDQLKALLVQANSLATSTPPIATTTPTVVTTTSAEGQDSTSGNVGTGTSATTSIETSTDTITNTTASTTQTTIEDTNITDTSSSTPSIIQETLIEQAITPSPESTPEPSPSPTPTLEPTPIEVETTPPPSESASVSTPIIP
ncbi:MAG: tail fiber domain-containing protein, partial [Candidatus Paceibacterota bacterium]